MYYFFVFYAYISDDLQRQNDLLQREVEKQQVKLKQFSQLQELSAMLQESHK